MVVNTNYVGWCNALGTCRLRGQPPEVHPAKPSCRLNSQKRGWESRGRIALGEAGWMGGGENDLRGGGGEKRGNSYQSSKVKHGVWDRGDRG